MLQSGCHSRFHLRVQRRFDMWFQRLALIQLAGCSCDGVSWLPHADPVAEGIGCTTVVTWDNFAKEHVGTWCLQCHSVNVPLEARQGAPISVNFDLYEDVLAYKSKIELWATGADPAMPPAGGVFERDQVQFEEWLGCGAPGEGITEPSCTTAIVDSEHKDLVWTDQAGADAFCALYNSVEGDLRIEGGDIVAPCLCSVGGDLEIVAVETGATYLGVPKELLTSPRSVSLESLTSVGGHLTVQDGVHLESVSLPVLATVDGGDAMLADNPVLHTLWMPELAYVGGQFLLTNNPVLEEALLLQLETVVGSMEVSNLAALTTIDVIRLRWVEGDLVFRDLPVLADLETLDTVERVAGNVELVNLDGISLLQDAMFHVVDIVGRVDVSENDIVTLLDGFTLLLEGKNDILIRNNALLASLRAFDTMTVAHADIQIQGNGNLANVSGFVNLVEIEGDLVLEDNRQMQNVAGMGVLQSVGNDLIFEGNAGITIFTDFGALTNIGGDLRMTDNAQLVAIDAFPLLTSVGGDLFVADNSVLAGLTNFARLESTGGTLEVSENPALTTLDAFAKVTEVGGNFRLVGNSALVEMEGLVDLEAVAGTFRVSDNDLLSSLTSLESLAFVGLDVLVTDNPDLPTSDVEALVDGLDFVGGNIVVSGNGD